MSSLIIEVCEISEVVKHPNADKLDLVTIKGWQVIDGRGLRKPGERIIYVPPDSVLPEYLSDNLNVTQYCAPAYPKKDDGSRDPGSRVRAAKLRGVVSYGLLVDIPEGKDWQVGQDVAKYFGITKWEPPKKIIGGDMERELPSFVRYTEIENFKNFPEAIPEGTEVVMTEKIHGTNSRVGRLSDGSNRVWVAGSHTTQRKEPQEGEMSRYWEPLNKHMRDFILWLSEDDTKDVIVFGEIYGSGVQDMKYGLQNGKKDYRIFDIMIGGQYMSWEDMLQALNKFNDDLKAVDILKTVIPVYEGPFSRAILENRTTGPTQVCYPEDAGKFKGREGVVVKPMIEDYSDELFGRLILKNISPDYQTRKGATEDH